ncbi:mitochondrial Rho GTPase 1-like isoform X2 [Oryza brachyantha]|uniref:mitochondrial Rho GTPase 1-like isoform X2 n=1 Tax=Oryza brachyantha TaxID=4533 RepID=UPI000776670A|nr:mitochondrial Rho GTPase 1-like isoform X2 [Oryza brachyantha]
MEPFMRRFREIEIGIECSALCQFQVAEIFYYAQEAVIHPIDPIFDYETQFLRPRCVAALNRIFSLCDRDGDGALSDVEFNKFQVRTH